MNRIRTVTVLAVLGVILAGISMANKPNEGDGYNITVSPNTLMLSRDITCVTVHSNIPYSKEYAVSLKIGEQDPIASSLTKPDSCGDLVAKFDGDAVKKVVEPGFVEFTLEVQGEEVFFTASDTVRVKE